MVLEEITRQTNENIVGYLQNNRLRLVGHVVSSNDNRLKKQCVLGKTRWKKICTTAYKKVERCSETVSAENGRKTM